MYILMKKLLHMTYVINHILGHYLLGCYNRNPMVSSPQPLVGSAVYFLSPPFMIQESLVMVVSVGF